MPPRRRKRRKPLGDAIPAERVQLDADAQVSRADAIKARTYWRRVVPPPLNRLLDAPSAEE